MVIIPDRERRDILSEMLTNWQIDAASIDSPQAAVEVFKCVLQGRKALLLRPH